MFSLYPFRYGHGRVVDATLLARSLIEQHRETVRVTDGFLIDIMPNDHIGRHLRLTGQFDRTIPDVLVALAKPGDHFLDIGANIGYVSCMLLHRVPRVRVAAVEPRPDCFELLRDNLRRLSPIAIAVRAAISDTVGNGTLEQSNDNSGASKLVGSGRADEIEVGNRISVELLSAALVLQRTEFERVDLVKIDVEGHEEAVLRSLLSVVQENPPRAIVFEHHGGFQGESRPLFDSLLEAGYEVLGIRKAPFKWTLVPVSGDEARVIYTDYVARRR